MVSTDDDRDLQETAAGTVDAPEPAEDLQAHSPNGNAGEAPVSDEPGAGAESLRDLVIYLVTNLVDDPEEIEASVERRGGAVVLRLRVPEVELGRVIGRQGRIARALRTALMVAASRHNLRVSLDIEPL